MWEAIAKAGGELLGDIIGNKMQSESAEDQALANYNRQKEFAQMGIRWKVEDAKAAGLHPLYALGGSGAAFSPNPIVVGQSGLGSALGSMGQNLARAAQAGSEKGENETLNLQQELLRAQIRKTNAEASAVEFSGPGAAATAYPFQLGAGAPRGLPGDIQSWQVRELGQDAPVGPPSQKSPLIKFEPSKTTSYFPGDISREASPMTGIKEVNLTPYGLKLQMPASDDPWETWGEMSWYDKIPWIMRSATSSGNPQEWLRRYYKEFMLNQPLEYRQYVPPSGRRAPFYGHR